MDNNAKFFGFWIVVKDEDSARYAIRMAGLPLLIMGVNVGLFCLVMATQESVNQTILIGTAFTAILLIILAFRIRSGGSAWIPFATFLFSSFLAMIVVLSLIGLNQGDRTLFQGVRIVISWIIPMICAVLCIGGVRGWFWLRQQSSP